jgi:tetraacyldisaccharide 4'-kinase
MNDGYGFGPGDGVRARLESRMLQSWYGDRPPPVWARAGEPVFRILAAARRGLFEAGVRRSRKMPVPVIVVGNLAVGGTGKTPLVLWLCEWLVGQGRRPGISCRGYGGSARRWPQVVESGSDAAVVGDEAVLLARRSCCPVVAGPSRVDSAELLLDLGVDVIVCDDGLQHYALDRDVEIVVVDGARGFGNGRCLPAGPLREPLGRLDRADVVVCNGGTEAEFPYALAMRVVPRALHAMGDSPREEAPAVLAGRKVHAVAAIGNPQRFFDTLSALGAIVVAHAFPDHARLEPGQLDFGDGHPVIMTEKDAVKYDFPMAGECWYLSVSAEFDHADATRLIAQLSAQLRLDEKEETT